MRVLTLAFSGVLLTSALAAEPVTVVSGHTCRGPDLNFAVRLHADRQLNSCFLAEDQLVDDVPCAAWTREGDAAARRRGFTMAAIFFPGGRLRQCVASRDFTRGSRSYRAGESVRLDPAGAPLAATRRPFAIVYPTIVRTSTTSGFDLASRDRIARELASKLGLEVLSSARPLTYDLPPGSQWDAFQAGIDSLGRQLTPEAEGASFHIITELLVTGTRQGGEAVAGIHVYTFDSAGFGGWSAIITSDDPDFARARLQTKKGSRREVLLDRTADFVSGGFVEHYGPMAKAFER